MAPIDQEASGRPAQEVDSAFLFTSVTVGSPLDELRATVERKVQMYLSLDEAENARRCSLAHELARSRLEAMLGPPRCASGG